MNLWGVCLNLDFLSLNSPWRVQDCDVPSPSPGTRWTGGHRCARWTPHPQSEGSREMAASRCMFPAPSLSSSTHWSSPPTVVKQGKLSVAAKSPVICLSLKTFDHKKSCWHPEDFLNSSYCLKKPTTPTCPPNKNKSSHIWQYMSFAYAMLVSVYQNCWDMIIAKIQMTFFWSVTKWWKVHAFPWCLNTTVRLHMFAVTIPPVHIGH